MADNTKAWTLGVILGIIGVILSAGVLIYITLKTERIFGIVTIISGIISGGAVGLGYKLGKGNLTSKSQVQMFLWILTFFGLLGVSAAYFGPYILFAANGISFLDYISLIGFGFMDIIFILIGAYGGRYAGESLARSIILDELRHEQIKKKH